MSERANLPRFLLAVCSVLLIITAPASAEEFPHKQVIVTDRDGRTHAGPVARFSDGQIVIGPSDGPRIPTKNLIRLQGKNRVARLDSADPLVVLANGDLLAARVEAADEEALTVRWVRFTVWPAVKIPLEMIRGVILQRAGEPGADARMLNRVFEYREPRDAVVLQNGDSLVGEVEALDDKRLVLASGGTKSEVGRDGIRLVAFNSDLVSMPALAGEGALVTLVDGSRFRAKDLRLITLDRLSMRTLFGATLEVPFPAIESLRFLGGCAVWLGDLEPVEAKSQPYLDLEWPLVRNRNVLGGLLRLRGVEYASGLGVHSQSVVTYRIDGKYRRFFATTGIDDDAGGKGSVTFEVQLDGKPAWQSDVVTGSSPALVLPPIDISKAKQLTLRVDFATLGDVQDHADWCDAVVVK